MMATASKVTSEHLRRQAYLYVRQSSLQQVHDHRESTARQYDLKRRAHALGWPAEQIVVIDEDLGLSGASAVERNGFQRLVAEVGLGRVGLVMGLEVSRLARNSSDWHRLLEICALAETLILDEDGIYDPSHFNDRLLLGLKGTMSEAELHVLRARLLGGQLNKARRGELWMRPPIGFVIDRTGRLSLDPDAQIQATVRLLFETFRRTGSAQRSCATSPSGDSAGRAGSPPGAARASSCSPRWRTVACSASSTIRGMPGPSCTAARASAKCASRARRGTGVCPARSGRSFSPTPTRATSRGRSTRRIRRRSSPMPPATGPIDDAVRRAKASRSCKAW